MRIKYDYLEERTARTDDEQCRKLWASVLLMAVRDMNTISRRRDAHHWVYGPRTDVGSASWVCSVLNLDISKFQQLCVTREGRKKILGASRDDV